MTRRDAIAGVVGAIAAAAVLVGVYEATATPSRPTASVDTAPGQGASGASVDAGGAVEAFGRDDPWRAANASLVDQMKECRHRLAASETELKKVKTALVSLEPDADGPLGAWARRDPFNPTTQDDWKELAKFGVVRAKNFCFPKADWQPSDDELSDLGLTPADTPALTQALAAAAQRLWQATQPTCAKLVGADEANRIGDDACFTIILHSFPESQWSADAQLVSNIRAGNVPMPPPDKLDALATRLLAMTSAVSDLEKDLTQSFGPELAHEIASGDTPWGPCTVQLGEGARTGKLPMPQGGSFKK
jgi:hypothetical protein